VLGQSFHHRRRWQDVTPRRGQLNGQRQAVEPHAELSNRARVLVAELESGVAFPRPRDEERNRLMADHVRYPHLGCQPRRCQRRHRHHLFAPNPEGLAAGDEEPRVSSNPPHGARLEQVTDDRSRREQVLEIVEHEHHRVCRQTRRQTRLEAIGQRRRCSLPHTDGGGDGGQREQRVSDGCKVDKDDFGGGARGEAPRRLDGEPGLADTRWSGQCQQSVAGVMQRLEDCGQLRFASDELVQDRGATGGPE
jgi:hypothetical protein